MTPYYARPPSQPWSRVWTAAPSPPTPLDPPFRVAPPTHGPIPKHPPPPSRPLYPFLWPYAGRVAFVTSNQASPSTGLASCAGVMTLKPSSVLIKDGRRDGGLVGVA
ncbi:hypothetical protein NL676_024560 [Syzygium grande]|nr:hypothetical protein NL676_024560 [Syzygium grande]